MEFLNGLGMLSATIVGAAGVSFGLCAGVHLAYFVFGPLKVGVNVSTINVVNRDAVDDKPGESPAPFIPAKRVPQSHDIGDAKK